MGKKRIPRDPFVRASFERGNNLGKGKAIRSDKERLEQDRNFRKNIFRKEIKGSRYDDSSPFFIPHSPRWKQIHQKNHCLVSSVIISASGLDRIESDPRYDFAA